jgi:hypothetical protein
MFSGIPELHKPAASSSYHTPLAVITKPKVSPDIIQCPQVQNHLRIALSKYIPLKRDEKCYWRNPPYYIQTHSNLISSNFFIDVQVTAKELGQSSSPYGS